MVLRHELGHNFGSVGEEYDGGSAYFGANFANSVPQATTKWRAWLDADPIVIQEDILRVQDYPWYLLENGPRSYTFSSSGTYKSWYLSFTASGCPEPDSFSVFLDNVPLQIEAPNTEDRTFYKIISDVPLTAGNHQLLWRQNFPPTGQNKRQLCSLSLKEYMGEPEFHWEEYYSAYRTWRVGNTLAGYRSNNEFCLMRNMSSPNFCKICEENMWIQFFQQISAIDNITETCQGTSITIKLNVIALGQFRDVPIPGETYDLRWYWNGSHFPDYDNVFEWTAERSLRLGLWRAELQFTTLQVRQDPNNLLLFEGSRTISNSPCLQKE